MSAWVVSKTHIDLLVQAAVAGPSDGVNWNEHGRHFSWYHDSVAYELDPHATEVGGTNGARRIVTLSEFGQKLVSECVRSVEGRYPDTNAEDGDLPGPCDAYYMGPYVFEPATTTTVRVISAGMPLAIVAPATTAEIAMQIACYEYQSCEHDEWETSEAHTICRTLKDQLLSSLPGYSAAPWGWDERRSA